MNAQTATSVSAYAAAAAGAPLERTTIPRRPVGEHDVLIEIKYTGICHTDIARARGYTGDGAFPMVPGHEIAGVVTAVGPGVTRYEVGDQAGVGCLVDSCRKCGNCAAGLEQFCTLGPVETYNGTGADGERTYGGFATHIVVDENYVLRIPDGISLASAAPLLCAGITLYSPLAHWRAGPGTKAAIVGLGGLGHMGVKIAHGMGAEVTVLSRSLRKKDDAARLGADHFYATSDPATFEQLAGRFDLIINTVAANLDLDAYLSLLATDGTFVNVGVPPAPGSLSMFSLIGGRKTLAGSLIGGLAETQRMLDFCAEHRIGADVEVVSAEQINEAFERIVAADVRYRFVIDASTISHKEF
ncbi:NAD(P)-dependent alcohol dehydrogenase [Streptomyces boninensis]|uniref:NAD(P)-dependent alcohol dehydrogenase n=1 Tax=Streptomyces boninensis TaxID=2039455 RepID=UPI003B215971